MPARPKVGPSSRTRGRFRPAGPRLSWRRGPIRQRPGRRRSEWGAGDREAGAMSEREQPLTDELTRRHAVGLAASLALSAALRPNFSLAREPEPGDDHGGGGHG